MKRIFLLSLMLKLGIISGVAQPSLTISNAEKAGKLRDNILAVVLVEPDAKTLKKLAKKPDELAEYESSFEKYNTFIKQAVDNEWNLSKEVRYISVEEAEKLKHDKPDGVSLLELVEVKKYKMDDFFTPKKKEDPNPPHDMAYHLSRSTGESLALAVAHASSPRNEIAISYLPTTGMSQGVVTYMVMHLKNQITDCLSDEVTRFADLKRAIAKRQDLLKSKTLLIFDPLISSALKKAIEKKGSEKYYKFKHEVVSFDRADELIAAKNGDYAYVWVVPSGEVEGKKVLFNYYVIDAADGRPLFLTERTVDGANGEIHQTHLTMISKAIK